MLVLLNTIRNSLTRTGNDHSRRRNLFRKLYVFVRRYLEYATVLTPYYFPRCSPSVRHSLACLAKRNDERWQHEKKPKIEKKEFHNPSELRFEK